jgi:hypothetical protein
MSREDIDSQLQKLKDDVLQLKKQPSAEQRVILLSTFDPIYLAATSSSASTKYRTFACDTLSVWISRALQLFAKAPEYKPDFELLLIGERADEIFHYVIDFWNDSGAAFSNALKELFVKMMSYMSAVLDQDTRNETFGTWLSTVLEMPYTNRAFYFMIEHLHKNVEPANFVLLKKPHFVSDCLENIWSRAIGSIVGRCVFLILRHTYKEGEEDKWLSLWEDQIINCLRDINVRQGVERYLLPNLFQVSRLASLKFLGKVRKQNDVTMLLSTLKVAQDNSILIEPFLELDPVTNLPLIDITAIQNLLKVPTASFRVSAFQLLVSSPKHSKAISPVVYETIIDSLDMIFNDSDLETRNELLSYLKIFVGRIKESTYALHRDAVSLTKKNYTKFENEIKGKQKSVKQSEEFLSTLIQCIQSNLTLGSSYLKKEMAYRMLLILIKSGVDSRVDVKYLEKSKSVNFPYCLEIYNPALIRLVIDNILDNYEDIRRYSTDVISISPFKLNELVDMELLEFRALAMLNDMKGNEVDSGARYFKFAFGYYLKENNMKKCKDIVTLLLGKIEEALAQARENLVMASIHYSIQGYFAAFKFIFEVMDFKKCSTLVQETNAIPSLIGYTEQIWSVVKIIMQHDSPEGILLEEFQASYTQELEEKYGKATQVISSYAWRSIKESTNMIDSILRAKNTPITSESILSLGPLLLEQLATIRHRGAFSSVYPTFISCCLLCRSKPDLSETPKRWLEENLELIQSRSMYITRRSAGIPYLITAILSSNRTLIKKTFDTLVEIAKAPVEEQNADMDNVNLPQVNAFNCIKTIFVDAALSEESIHYVDEAFALTLNSFASPFWAIRNCAVMMFTALQNRLFSSKKVKANYLPSYSARRFFEKFDSIHGLFLSSLQESVAKGLENQTEIEKVFPILTIMSRLEPTPGYKGLDAFIPIMLQILESRTWKVREMAARSIPSMIDNSDKFSTIIGYLIDNISEDSRDFNRMHGSLLAIREMILKFQALSSDESSETVDKLFERGNITRSAILSKLTLVLNQINCYPIKHVYFQVLAILDVSEADSSALSETLLQWFSTENCIASKLDGSKQLALRELSTLLFRLYPASSQLIRCTLLSPLYEVQLSCIEHHELILESLPTATVSLLIENVWKLLESETVWVHVRSQALKLLTKLIVASSEVDSDEKLEVYTTKLMKMLEINGNYDLRLSIVEAVGSYIARLMIHGGAKHLALYNHWVAKVEGMFGDNEEVVVRVAALKSMVAFNELYSQYGDDEKIKFQIMSYIFEFLMDDDESISNIASRHLNRYILTTEDDVLPVITEKLMVEHYCSFNTELLELLVGNERLNFFDRSVKLCDLVTTTTLLFAAEKANLDRDPIEKVKELTCIIRNSKLENSTTLISIAQYVEENLNDLVHYIKTHHIIDGCFGFFSDEKIFEFTYTQLLMYKCLKERGATNFDVTDLRHTLENANIFCHPMILDLL